MAKLISLLRSGDFLTRQRVTILAGGLIAGQFQTDPGKVAQAIDIVRTEWQRMATEGPTQQELDDAKTYLLGYYPRNFTNTMDTAQLLRGLQTEDLGIDYIIKRNGLVDAVTLDDLKRVSKRILDVGMLALVVGRTPTATVSAGGATTPVAGQPSAAPAPVQTK